MDKELNVLKYESDWFTTSLADVNLYILIPNHKLSLHSLAFDY